MFMYEIETYLSRQVESRNSDLRPHLHGHLGAETVLVVVEAVDLTLTRADVVVVRHGRSQLHVLHLLGRRDLLSKAIYYNSL